MPTIRISQPALEPVTLDEAKAQCKVTHDVEDALISIYIAAARELAEGELNRTLITSTWRMQAGGFSRALRLDWPLIQSVTSVQYLDTAGDLQTLDVADYRLDNTNPVGPGLLVPAPGRSWPVTSAEPAAVRVEYVAGYGDAPGDVPKGIQQWMLLHIAAMYEQREAAGKDLAPLAFLDGLIRHQKVIVV